MKIDIPFRRALRLCLLPLLLPGGTALAQVQHLPTPVAPTQAPAATREVAAKPAEIHARPALWVVRDRDTTIYLFGTIHLLKPGITWLSGPLARALARSHELVTEIEDPRGADTQSAVLSHATLPEGQTLRGLMAPGQKTALEALLVRIRLPADGLDRYKPWYAAVVLSSLPLVKEGFDPRKGVEAALTERATARKLRTRALETPDYQLGLFDSLPQDAQLSFLASVVRDYDTIVPQIDTLIAEWTRGDAAGLAKTMNAEMDDPRLEAVLLVQRNRNWAQWIRQRMKRPGTVFVAVGAGHLAGRGSVQAELARSGLIARRVQ